MVNVTESRENSQFANRDVSPNALHFTPGLWVNGRYYWLANSLEKIFPQEELLIQVKQEQVHSKIRLSSIYISNHSIVKKEVKLLVMHHHTKISNEQLTFVSPADNKIFHIADQHVFLVNGKSSVSPIRECTVMPQWNVFTDRIWNSLNHGTLKFQPMLKGIASSLFTVKLSIEPHETKMAHTWTIGGTNKQEVLLLEQGLLKNRLAFPPDK
jgi:hypothetical protein